VNLLANFCERLDHSNPWQAPFDRLPFDPHGWFDNEGSQSLDLIFRGRENTQYCLELGSWLGASTRFLAERYSLVVAVDHWKGSQEHHKKSRTDAQVRLPVLYQQFMSNCESMSDRILPLKMTTQEAFDLFHKSNLGRIFDLVYIDASHDFESVTEDLVGAMKFVAESGVVCGDDWTWWGNRSPVRKAVEQFADSHTLEIEVCGDFWQLKKC
jgi:predicted O-methyltransferase YrrM